MVMYFIDRRPRITDQLQVCHDTLTCVSVHNEHWGGGGGGGGGGGTKG